MKIVVIDDSDIFRSGVISHLTKMPKISKVSGGVFTEENINRLVDSSTDFLIIDFEHKKTLNLDIVNRLKNKFNNMKVIGVTRDKNRPIKFMKHKIGTDYLFLKDADYPRFMNVLSLIGYN